MLTNCSCINPRNGETKCCGKADSAQHAQRVFLNALGRFSNEAQNLLVNISEPTVEINQYFFCWVVENCVHGKVTPASILAGIRHKLYGVWMAAVSVLAVNSERGNLNPAFDTHSTKLLANVKKSFSHFREKFLELRWR